MTPRNNNDGSDEEDYMSMSFADADEPESKPLTSLQRRQQEKRLAEARARPKSKAQLAEEEAAARQASLSRSLLDDPKAQKSKGFAMMARMGFKAGSALGAAGSKGVTEPLKLVVKEDRGGIGMESEKRRRFREAFGEDGDEEGEAKKKKVGEDPIAYRDRMARERDAARVERLVASAQRIAEGMAEEAETEAEEQGVVSKGSEDGAKRKKHCSSGPLKSVNVLWRGLVRRREEAERNARMRRDMEQSLSRLPTYEDSDEDEDDKRALGRDAKTVYVFAEDLDEEDPELDEFEALEPHEKLRRLVVFLRDEFCYCFWCKTTYPDAQMDGCPGLTEEDHD
ncbi:hypothetical protein ACRALDRAFT_2042533 [Sodiomyces alcalophilus JCM 7366]|uniref:uncharacterized protein n=1 Tax=Sodiomyces alcalophilus JCM 7366 TaxID=591952 RepID=UPI0039B41CB6